MELFSDLEKGISIFFNGTHYEVRSIYQAGCSDEVFYKVRDVFETFDEAVEGAYLII